MDKKKNSVSDYYGDCNHKINGEYSISLDDSGRIICNICGEKLTYSEINLILD